MFISFPLHQKGFTLIELITTLAIVSLLITISYPIYTQYVTKTHRTHAVVALLDLASSLERYHTVHHTYADATLADLQVNPYTDTKIYQLEIKDATENSYTVNAIPVGTQQKDTACGILSLNQLGEKSISGSGKVLDCW